MDFSKLRSGAIDLANFLVGSGLWFGAVVGSVYLAFPTAIRSLAASVVDLVLPLLRDSSIGTLLETFGLKSLIPVLAFFSFVFVAHVTRAVLSAIGDFVPPEIVMTDMPGLRDIKPDIWHTVLDTLEWKLSVHECVSVLRPMYEEELQSRYSWSTSSLRSSFAELKAFAVLNIGLIGASVTLGDGLSLGNAAAAFAGMVGAAAAATVVIYRSRLGSRWALYQAMDRLERQALEVRRSRSGSEHSTRAEAGEQEVPRKSVPTRAHLDAIDDTVLAYRRARWFRLGSNLPLLGSPQILREFIQDRREAEKFERTVTARRTHEKSSTGDVE